MFQESKSGIEKAKKLTRKLLDKLRSSFQVKQSPYLNTEENAYYWLYEGDEPMRKHILRTAIHRRSVIGEIPTIGNARDLRAFTLDDLQASPQRN